MSTTSPPTLPPATIERIHQVLDTLHPHCQTKGFTVQPLTKAISSSSVWLVELASPQADISSPKASQPCSLVVRLLQPTDSNVQQQTQVHAAVLQLVYQQKEDQQLHRYLPTILHSDEHMVIESCLPGVDLSSLTDTAQLASDFWLHLGHLLAQVHRVDVGHIRGCGSLQVRHDGSLCCSHDRWTAYIDDMWRQRLNTAVAAGLLSTTEAALLDLLFTALTPSRRPHRPMQLVLLHADVNSSNIRADVRDDMYAFAGLIDFGDSMIGDRLFDFGRFYSHLSSNALFTHLDHTQRWQIIDDMVQARDNNRQPCTLYERSLITCYALWYTLWLLTLFGATGDANRHKYRKTLFALEDEWHCRAPTVGPEQ